MKKILIKVVLISLAVILLGSIIIKLDNDYMKGCMSQGYSKDYCEAHK